MAYWTEDVKANDARNKVTVVHATDLNISDSAVTLLSGTAMWDYDKATLHCYSSGGQAINYQVWVSCVSGTGIALTTMASGGRDWCALGDPITVANGASAVRSFETTSGKYVSVTGSAAAATTGANVHLYLKTRH